MGLKFRYREKHMDIEVNGLKDLTKSLDKMADIDTKSVLKDYGQFLVQFAQDNIDAQKDYTGKPLKGWASSSLGGRRQNGSIITPSSPLLKDTGKLYEGFTFKASDVELSILNKASYYEFATASRPILGITDELTAKISDSILSKYVKEWNK